MVQKSNQVYIIAEAGVNHNGSLECARELVKEASSAGADAIKFQTFRAETLVTAQAPKASYQKLSTPEEESQYEMLKKLELSLDDHKNLKDLCNSNNIDFLSTPFDLASISLLSGLGISTWKIPSGEITNLPYLRQIGSLAQSIILSTGMAYLSEIEDAIAILNTAGTALGNITVLHCNTAYPTPVQDVNLKAIQTIKGAFPLVNVGFSDHTEGIEASIAATALGASVIEKHFTMDKTQDGPDHKASIEPRELAQMISAIRYTKKAMGDGIKKPSSSEKINIAVARKSIVAKTDIAENEYFTEDNLTVKRPGSGLCPMYWDKTIGKKARRDYRKDELIDS